ncbi:MAG TPA: serine--tRNA ligase, partial [Rhabdochlamydiaceae bacterium]
MLDMKWLRKDPKAIEAKLKTKDPSIDLSSIIELDEKMRDILVKVESLKAERNQLSKQIGEKKRLKEDTAELMQQVGGIGDRATALDHELAALEKELSFKVASLPNIPMDGSKVSPDPKDNVCIKTVGEKPTFAFPFKNHVELNEQLHLFDFKRGAKISGSGWPVYRGWGARLEWALLNYMLDVHLDNGFEQWMIPHLVRPDVMFGSGQLPKFEKQLFQIRDDDYHLYLIPTSEVALNGLHYDEIF